MTSPNTLTGMDSVMVVPRILLPPDTLAVHVYSPSSRFFTSDTVRLLVYDNPELDTLTEYSSPLINLGPPHEIKTDPKAST